MSHNPWDKTVLSQSDIDLGQNVGEKQIALNSLATGSYFQANHTDLMLMYLSWNCPQMNATGP